MTQAAEETLKRLRGESRKHLRDIAATARRRAEQDMSTSNDFTGHQASVGGKGRAHARYQLVSDADR
jgi:hypothetical protein